MIADNGYFALITSTDDYNSVVEVYNDDFNLITRYNKNGFVVAVDIRLENILIVTVDSDSVNNSFSTEIVLSNLRGDFSKKNKFDSEFPIASSLTEYGIAVLYESKVQFFDYRAERIGEYSYNQEELNGFSISDSHTLILFKKPGIDIEYNMICIDKTGNVIYNNIINETVFDIELFDSTAFVLTNNNVFAIDSQSQKSIEVQNADYQCSLLPINNHCIYFCSTTCANYLDFSKLN